MGQRHKRLGWRAFSACLIVLEQEAQIVSFFFCRASDVHVSYTKYGRFLSTEAERTRMFCQADFVNVSQNARHRFLFVHSHHPADAVREELYSPHTAYFRPSKQQNRKQRNVMLDKNRCLQLHQYPCTSRGNPYTACFGREVANSKVVKRHVRRKLLFTATLNPCFR